jgi:hypothetical protein
MSRPIGNDPIMRGPANVHSYTLNGTFTAICLVPMLHSLYRDVRERVGQFLMNIVHSRHAETVKDRRRPGRIDNVSSSLIPILRNPIAGSKSKPPGLPQLIRPMSGSV